MLQGCIVVKREYLTENRFITHFCEIDPNAWISVTSRKPIKADTDAYGCVIAMNRWGHILMAGWRRFEQETSLTHWQRPPDGPQTQRQGGI